VVAKTYDRRAVVMIALPVATVVALPARLLASRAMSVVAVFLGVLARLWLWPLLRPWRVIVMRAFGARRRLLGCGHDGSRRRCGLARRCVFAGRVFVGRVFMGRTLTRGMIARCMLAMPPAMIPARTRLAFVAMLAALGASLAE